MIAISVIELKSNESNLFVTELTPLTAATIEPHMIIEVRPCKRFKGAWVAFEAPGVEPAFATPDAKRKAIDYACERFGGSAGEVHVHDESGEIVERKIAVEGRGQYPQGVVIKRSSAAAKSQRFSGSGLHDYI